MLDIMEYEDIKRYKKYITTDLNTNSKLYFDKNLIHKIPIKTDFNLRFILEYIDNLNLNELVELRKVIYSKDGFVGYSMINYKEYKSLKKLKLRNFDLKKEDCFKILKSFINLKQNSLSYSDFHKGNILLDPKTNDIKICDLDCINISPNPFLNKNELQKILILILSYLYNIKECDIRNVLNSHGLSDNNAYINRCSSRYDYIDLNQLYRIIDFIKEDYIYEEKKHIIVKSKELSETGYSKYLRY